VSTQLVWELMCCHLHVTEGSFTLQAEPSRTEPDRTELNRAERVTIHIAGRADPNGKQCS